MIRTDTELHLPSFRRSGPVLAAAAFSLLLATASPSLAQSRPTTRSGAGYEGPGDELRAGLGALVGGAAGLTAGAFVGALATDGDGPDDLDFLRGAVFGGLVGEIVGVTAGAYLADPQAESWGRGLAAAALTGLATVGIANLADGDGQAVILSAGALLQIVATVRAQRSWGARPVDDRADLLPGPRPAAPTLDSHDLGRFAPTRANARAW